MPRPMTRNIVHTVCMHAIASSPSRARTTYLDWPMPRRKEVRYVRGLLIGARVVFDLAPRSAR